MRIPSGLCAAALLIFAASAPAAAGWMEADSAYKRQDWTTAAAELKPLAAAGHAAAQARLGRLLFDGMGVPKDEAAATRLLGEAAGAGEAFAQLWLANAYLSGRGVPGDVDKALSLLEKAAAANMPEALFNLGDFLFNGRLGRARDEVRGVGYLTRAANLGQARSYEPLTIAHWEGRGVPRDRGRAIDYAKKAATAGSTIAEALLGVALWNGDGLPKDRAAAVPWFRKAAEKGQPGAQYNLAQALGSGVGATNDPGEAYFWLILAAARAAPNDRLNFEKARDAAALKLAPEAAARQRERAQAWKPEGPVVTVTVPPAPAQKRVTSGSGVLVAPDGSVLTNAHVVERCRSLRLQVADNVWHPATIAARDTANDLALLKTGMQAPEVARFREGAPLRSGDDVVVVGFPLSTILSREANVTAGVVSAMAGIRGDQRFYQLTAPVQKGNSGGPLADMSGNVVGIVSLKLDAGKIARSTGDIPQNVNFAIKQDLARKFLADNGVTPLTAPAGQRLSAADVGERIKRVTAFIECEQ